MGLFSTGVFPLFSDPQAKPLYNRPAPQPRGTTDSSITLSVEPLTITSVVPESFAANAQLLHRSGISKDALARLFRLAEKQYGWKDPTSQSLKAFSLRAFAMFWMLLPQGSREPFLTLTPNGNLLAQWHASWRRHLDIEFASDEVLYFGLFDHREVIEGKARLSSLVEMLRHRKNSPFSWKRS